MRSALFLLAALASGAAAHAQEAPSDTLFPGRLALGAGLLVIPDAAPGVSARLYAHPFLVDANLHAGYTADRFRSTGITEYSGVTADLSVLVPFRRTGGLLEGTHLTSALGLGVAWERLSTEGQDPESILGVGLSSSSSLVVADRAELFVDTQTGINLVTPDEPNDEFLGDVSDLFFRIRAGLRAYLL